MRNIALPFPKSILIETLNLCQGKCKFCPYQKIRTKEKPVFLSLDVYERIINEISKHDIRRLTLFNNNEPLLDKRIFDFIRYARNKLPLVEITLSTNGIMLTNSI